MSNFFNWEKGFSVIPLPDNQIDPETTETPRNADRSDDDDN
jgi:hypothetical protein